MLSNNDKVKIELRKWQLLYIMRCLTMLTVDTEDDVFEQAQDLHDVLMNQLAEAEEARKKKEDEKAFRKEKGI